MSLDFPQLEFGDPACILAGSTGPHSVGFTCADVDRRALCASLAAASRSVPVAVRCGRWQLRLATLVATETRDLIDELRRMVRDHRPDYPRFEVCPSQRVANGRVGRNR
nr:hypothetical protein GCM10017611_79060 [Rhodococcus wratislaviensis]